jgi:hypothetical protein
MESIVNPSRKRKRQDLSHHMKKEICLYQKNHPKATHQEIANAISLNNNLEAIGRRTIGDVLKEKEKWLSIPTPSKEISRQRSGLYLKLEEALKMWLDDKVSFSFTLRI